MVMGVGRESKVIYNDSYAFMLEKESVLYYV